jgi:hypothetical protein
MSNIYSAASVIKDQLIVKVHSLDSVQIVYPAEQPNPSGWPAVFVTEADLEGEFASNAENSRTYAYNVTILFPEGQDFVPEAERSRLDYSARIISGVVDEIINAVDTDFELDSLPNDTTVLFVNAADCLWGRYEYEGGIAKAAQVTLKVYTEVTVV